MDNNSKVADVLTGSAMAPTPASDVYYSSAAAYFDPSNSGVYPAPETLS